MDPVNLLVGINLFVSISANWSAAKKGFKGAVTSAKDRPKTFLQKAPPNISALILILIILGIFNIGVLDKELMKNYDAMRYTGLIVFILFSWLQVASYKSLGKNYSQEIVIFKGHELITSGLYKTIRHPQYLCQLLSDLGAGLALISYLAIPLIILVEIPLFILRASFEEKILSKHFGEKFNEYKKHSGFIIPYIG